MTKYADNPATEAARKALAEDKQALEKTRAEYAQRMAGKPTPTQEENDMAKLGAQILEHEDDGSGPDPFNFSPRHMDAGHGGGYSTRQSHASGGGGAATTHRPPRKAED